MQPRLWLPAPTGPTLVSSGTVSEICRAIVAADDFIEDCETLRHPLLIGLALRIEAPFGGGQQLGCPPFMPRVTLGDGFLHRLIQLTGEISLQPGYIDGWSRRRR